MHYLYYIFRRFYTSIPIKTSKENIEVSTMSGLCITLLFNVLAVVEVICQGLEIKSAEIMLAVYLTITLLMIVVLGSYYTEERIEIIMEEYKGYSYKLSLLLYVVSSFFLFVLVARG